MKTLDGALARVAAAEAALTELALDMAHFAQLHHQAYHGERAATYETCPRGVCPGVVRSLARARAASSGD